MKKGQFICFCGVDGSGKTTLAMEAVDHLRGKGHKVKYVWLRMNYFFSRPLLLICRLTGLTKRPIVRGRKISVHEFYRFRPVAKLVQLTHLFDTAMFALFKVFIPLKLHKRVVVCDRYIHDVLIDFAVEGHEWNIFSSGIGRLSQELLPADAICFLVRAPKDIIVHRKPEVLDYDPNYQERYELYESLRSNRIFHVIENNGHQQDAITAVLRTIDARDSDAC